MRKTLISLTVAAVACTGLAGAASAQGVGIDVGPGGVYVGPRHDHDRRWRERETTGFGRDCRTIIRHEWRHGERITIRRRICD